MFEVTQSIENRLDIKVKGQLDSKTMKEVLESMISKSEKIENGKMLFMTDDYQFPTLGAIAIELSYLPSIFRLIKIFDRVAVLTDKTWLKKVSEFEGSLFPSLEIKAFNLDQKKDAEDWLLG